MYMPCQAVVQLLQYHNSCVLLHTISFLSLRLLSTCSRRYSDHGCVCRAIIAIVIGGSRGRGRCIILSCHTRFICIHQLLRKRFVPDSPLVTPVHGGRLECGKGSIEGCEDLLHGSVDVVASCDLLLHHGPDYFDWLEVAVVRWGVQNLVAVVSSVDKYSNTDTLVGNLQAFQNAGSSPASSEPRRSVANSCALLSFFNLLRWVAL